MSPTKLEDTLEELDSVRRELELKKLFSNPANLQILKSYLKAEEPPISPEDYIKITKEYPFTNKLFREYAEGAEKPLEFLAEKRSLTKEQKTLSEYYSNLKSIIKHPDKGPENTHIKTIEDNIRGAVVLGDLCCRGLKAEENFYIKVPAAVNSVALRHKITPEKVIENQEYRDESWVKIFPTREEAEQRIRIMQDTYKTYLQMEENFLSLCKAGSKIISNPSERIGRAEASCRKAEQLNQFNGLLLDLYRKKFDRVYSGNRRQFL